MSGIKDAGDAGVIPSLNRAGSQGRISPRRSVMPKF